MASVTAFNAQRMKQIEDETVVSGLVDANGRLLLSTREGTQIDAGYVKGDPGGPGEQGEQGDPGPQGLPGDSSLPAGTISLWAGEIVPANWLICNGAAVSRTTYASLFNAIGTKYGVGDGTTTFNLPNLSGRAPVGLDTTQTEFNVLGKTGGAKTHQLTIAEMPVHDHGGSTSSAYAYTDSGIFAAGGSTNFVPHTWGGAHVGSDNTYRNKTYHAHPIVGQGGGGAHNNLQPYQVVNFIIKTTAGETQGESELATRVGVLEANATPADFELRDKSNLLQQVFTGGGIRKVSSTGVSWTERFITLGSGRDEYSPEGYFDIDMPPNGTVIPVYGSLTLTSVTVANGQIPMDGWFTLYYDPPLGETNASDPSRFFIVAYHVSLSEPVPPSAIVVVSRNTDPNSASHTWGDGKNQDYWRTLALVNGWLHYTAGNAWAPGQWKFADDGQIVLRGLIYGGGSPGAITNFPSDYFPNNAEGLILYQAANGGLARFDIRREVGLWVQGYVAGGNNTWISLTGMSWYPGGV